MTKQEFYEVDRRQFMSGNLSRSHHGGVGGRQEDGLAHDRGDDADSDGLSAAASTGHSRWVELAGRLGVEGRGWRSRRC